jgi:hypothetical protein
MSKSIVTPLLPQKLLPEQVKTSKREPRERKQIPSLAQKSIHKPIDLLNITIQPSATSLAQRQNPRNHHPHSLPIYNMRQPQNNLLEYAESTFNPPQALVHNPAAISSLAHYSATLPSSQQ